VVFGDSDALRPGDPVYLIGNPLGLSGSVTAGIVSARERDTEQSGFGSFFQLDASLNHGNSGGPVFNAAGEVVGVATALQSPGSETGSVGLGLAIPGLDAKFAAEQLVGHRALRLGWIGAHIQPVNADIAAAVGLPAATGSIITQVDMDGPATRAGLRLGDIILRLADDDGTIPRTLSRRIARAVAGDVIELSVWRDGAQQSVKVVIGASPAEVAEAPAATPACTGTHTDRPDLGLVLGPVTDDVSRKLALRPHETGALVTDVRDNSVAAERGMTVGSLIENVQGRPVASPDDVRAALESARQAHRTLALLLVRNAQGLRWTALPLAAAP
jgi:serine protease Do